MTLAELRVWATDTFGPHSHLEGQIHAALQPLEEWLGHLARHGVPLELQPVGVLPTAKAADPIEASVEPLPPVVEVPVPVADDPKSKSTFKRNSNDT